MNAPTTADRPGRLLGQGTEQAFCEIELDALLAGRPQDEVNNPDGSFQLFRVSDAVASRYIDAAIRRPLRLCKDL